MKMKLKLKILLVFATILLAGGVKAQQIKATASLDSSKILIGDQVKLFLEVDHPKNVEVQFPEVPDSIADLIEVLNRSVIDTVEEKEIIKQVKAYTITCFDSGSYRIPPYWFKFDVNGTIDSVPSNGVTLNVFTIPIDSAMAKKGITDIKMPYKAPLTLKEVSPYILGIILLGAIIFFILYSIKRKKNNKPIFSRPQKPKEPAHIVALRELDRIKNEKVWQKGKTKQYYSELTDALREYIQDRFGIRSIEQTSEETIESFRIQKDLISDKNFANLSQLLRLSDLVKFAKYTPTPDDDSLSLVNAYFFINETKKEEPKKAEELKKESEETGDNNDEIVEEVEIK
jgi:hypothetical protein